MLSEGNVNLTERLVSRAVLLSISTLFGKLQEGEALCLDRCNDVGLQQWRCCLAHLSTNLAKFALRSANKDTPVKLGPPYRLCSDLIACISWYNLDN